MLEQTGRKLHRFWFAAGALAVLVMAVPYLVLGQDAIVTYHDQLDGEVIAYLLQAKHLFDGNSLPEFLNGASKTALLPPAPACVLLFLTGNGFGALAVMQILGSLCGYLGMYLLAKRETQLPWIAAAAGVLYGYLPFLPVYGLAQYGLPMLLYCLLEAKEGRHRKAAFIYGVLYALNSSLVLVGFGVLGALALWIIWLLITGRKGGSCQKWRSLLIIWIAMLCIYAAENLSLLAQTLGLGSTKGAASEEIISHKAEYVLAADSFWGGLVQGFLKGGQHSEDYHSTFLWAAAVTVICGLGVLAAAAFRAHGAGRKDILMSGAAQAGVSTGASGRDIPYERIRKLLTVIGISFGWNLFFALVSAFWNAAPGIFLRSHLQAAGAFQADRLLWMAPCFWYLILACGLALAAELMRGTFRGRRKMFPGIISGILMAAALCFTGITVLVGSNLKPNIQKMRNPDYKAISFNDYYAVGVYSQVEEFLNQLTGEPRENYRVVSLGIDPAAALYHGFYCLDGYSNNYSLAYKHAFREVIAPELEKSQYLTDYFDNWGNRCYLVSAECPGYYTIEKGGFFFQDYTLNTEALKKMGGKYLFSAAYIANAEEQGLTLLREEPFETEDSYYKIYVYELL